MKLSMLTRKWHKWLTLIVGLQFLFWTLSGFFMSFVPIEKVRSEGIYQEPAKQVLSEYKKYLPIEKVISLVGKNQTVVKVSLKTLRGKLVYEAENSEGVFTLVEALEGEILEPLKKDEVLTVSKNLFKGKAEVREVRLLEDKIIEFRGAYPVWRVDFDNLQQTSFYLDPLTGSLLARRSAVWRVYDFLWMLHIMDYSGRTDFNNWFLVFVAFLALCAVISGLFLIRYSFRKRDFKGLLKGKI